MAGRVKRPLNDLKDDLSAARKEWSLIVGNSFRHNKTGDIYLISDLAIDCKTNDVIVIYTKDYDVTVRFTRPLAQWIEMTEHGRRFEKVED